MGLLEPAVVDPDSGYRYYRPGQAHSAQLVRRFRDLGLPVADVKAVLATSDLTARDAILAGHLDRMREQLRQDRKSTRLNSSHQSTSRMPSSA